MQIDLHFMISICFIFVANYFEKKQRRLLVG